MAVDLARVLRACGGAVLLACSPGPVSAAMAADPACPIGLTREIPARPLSSPDGAQFARQVTGDDPRQREAAIEHEILRGNLPRFLRWLKPVKLRAKLRSGREVRATICVMPDYLAIGGDRNFLRIPMNLHTATTIAEHFGFVLPTRKMVDAIYEQSGAHLDPQPMQAGPQMRSTEYYLRHNRTIAQQRSALGIPLGVLISGDKKDVVISNRLAAHPGRIAIYGWHKLDGQPIQPLSTVHGANYADYSHGIRLVSDIMYIDGKATSVHKVLEDPDRATILSDEGPVEILSDLIPELSPRMIASLAGSSRPAGDRAGHSPAL
jgi:hypothetical protein